MWKNLVKYWLTGILIILPFQLTIADRIMQWSNNILNVRYLDEITIIIFMPVALFQIYKKKDLMNKINLSILLSLTAIVISGLLSGFINGNSLLITSMGTFDYIKNFIVIFIYAALLNGIEDFNKIFSLILRVAVFVGVMAFVQEFWAIITHYILGMNIFDKRIYILRALPSDWPVTDFWRYGIYRTPSLMFHPNNLGLYSLLILTIYLYSENKIKPYVFFFLFIGIFLSVSRMVYVAFLFLVGCQLLKNRKWILIPTVPIVALLLFMTVLPDLNLLSNLTKQEEFNKTEEFKKEEVNREENIFRVYAANKAKEIWHDHPALGVGPGMFGGEISIKFNSPVYKNYNYSPRWFEYMKPFGSIDQFWPQSLAEIGIIGTISFILLLLLLIIIFLQIGINAHITQPTGLYIGLAISTVYICLYTFGSGLNNTAFLFTFSAITGLGLKHENSSRK